MLRESSVWENEAIQDEGPGHAFKYSHIWRASGRQLTGEIKIIKYVIQYVK